MSQTHDRQRADHRGGHVLARGDGRLRPPRRVGLQGRAARGRSPPRRPRRPLHVPRRSRTALKAEGRVGDHPVFPGKPGPAARRIEDEDDVREVIELMRLNYDRIVEHSAVPEGAS